MGCTIAEIKEQGINKVRTLFKGNANSITLDNNIAKISYGPDFRVKTKAQAFNMVQRKVETINKWSQDTFKTDAFKGQWTKIYQNNDNISVEFTFPKPLMSAYINKNERESRIDDNINEEHPFLNKDNKTIIKTLKPVLNHLRDKTGIPYEIIEDSNEKYRARLRKHPTKDEYGVTINAAYADLSDAFHEYLHPILRGVAINSLDTFNSLYNELLDINDDFVQKAIAKVDKAYPEYKKDSLIYKEEVIVTAVGYMSDIKLQDKVSNWLQELWEAIVKFFETTLPFFPKTLDTTKNVANMTIGDLVDVLLDTETQIIVDNSFESLFTRDISIDNSEGLELVDEKDDSSIAEYIINYLDTKYKMPVRPFKPRKLTGEKMLLSSVDQLNQYIERQLTNPDINANYIPSIESTFRRSIRLEPVEEKIPALLPHMEKIEFVYKFSNYLDTKKGQKLSLNNPFVTMKSLRGIIKKGEDEGKEYETIKLNIPVTVNEAKAIQEFQKKLKDKYPNEKSLDVDTIQEEYIQFVDDKYKVSTLDVQGFPGYGMKNFLNRGYDYSNYYRKLFMSSEIYQGGHSFHPLDKYNIKTSTPSFNSLGWYVSVDIGDDIFHHEFQSDLLPELNEEYKSGSFDVNKYKQNILDKFLNKPAVQEDGTTKSFQLDKVNSEAQEKIKAIAGDHFHHYLYEKWSAYTESSPDHVMLYKINPEQDHTYDEEDSRFVHAELKVDTEQRLQRVANIVQSIAPEKIDLILQNIYFKPGSEDFKKLQSILDNFTYIDLYKAETLRGRDVDYTGPAQEFDELPWSRLEEPEYQYTTSVLKTQSVQGDGSMTRLTVKKPTDEYSVSFFIKSLPEIVQKQIEKEVGIYSESLKHLNKYSNQDQNIEKLVFDHKRFIIDNIFASLVNQTAFKANKLKNGYTNKRALQQKAKRSREYIKKQFKAYKRNKVKANQNIFRFEVLYDSLETEQRIFNHHRQQYLRIRNYYDNVKAESMPVLTAIVERDLLTAGIDIHNQTEEEQRKIKKVIEEKVAEAHEKVEKFEVHQTLYEKWFQTVILTSVNNVKLKHKKNYYYLPTAAASEAIEGNSRANPIYYTPDEAKAVKLGSDYMDKNVLGAFLSNNEAVEQNKEMIQGYMSRAGLTPGLEFSEIVDRLWVTDLVYENGYRQWVNRNSESLGKPSPTGPFFLALSKLSRKHNIKILLEQPEWSTTPLIKVDLTDYEPVNPERFSKLDTEQEGSFEQKMRDSQKDKSSDFQDYLKSKPKPKAQEFVKPDELQRSLNKTSIENDLFNGEIRDTTAKFLIRAGLFNLDLTETAEEIAKQMLITDARVKIVSVGDVLTNEKTGETHTVAGNTVATYADDKNIIYLNKDSFSSLNSEYIFETILHEVAHEFTTKVLDNPTTLQERNFRSEVSRLYKVYRSKLPEDEYKYGLRVDEYEFVAEILSNEAFREQLRGLDDADNRNLFQKFIDAIREFFGLGRIRNVNEALESIISISTNKPTKAQSVLSGVFRQKTKDFDETKDKREFEKEIKDTKSLIQNIISKIEAVKQRSGQQKGFATKTQKKFDELQKLMESLYEKSSNEALFEFTKFANAEIENLLKTFKRRRRKGILDSEFLFRTQAYAAIYNSLDDIEFIAERQYKNNHISDEEYLELSDALGKAKHNFDIYHDRYLLYAKDLVAEKLAKYNNKPYDTRKRQLEREYKQADTNLSKKDWVEEQLDKEIDELKEQSIEQIKDQLSRVPMDINSVYLNLTSEKNINNLIIQLLSQAIDHAEYDIRQNIITIRNQFAQAQTKLNPTGVNNKQKYGKMLSQDQDGNYFLISEYSPEFVRQLNLEREKLSKVNNEFGYGSKEGKKAYKQYMLWKKQNVSRTYDEFGRITSEVPTDKWKDKNYNKLTAAEREYIDFLKSQIEAADKQTNGYRSLIFKNLNNYSFYRLPAIRKSDLDLIMSGQLQDYLTDKFGDVYKIREDDVTRGQLDDAEVKQEENTETVQKLVTLSNEEKLLVPIHFRSKINPAQQSLDLPTIMLLNSYMSNEYAKKIELEADANLIIDIIAEADVVKTEPISSRIVKSIFAKNEFEEDDVTEKGIKSNLYRKLKSMVENRIYKITQVSTGSQIGNKDISQIANAVGKYTADLALAVNYLSALPNLFQGKIQNFIEGVGGNTFSNKDLIKAEQLYFAEMAGGGLMDIGNTVNNSKLSIILESFNVMGDFNAVKTEFERDNRFKALFRSSTLHGFNNIAEHYIQSTLTLAIMNSVKIKNAQGEFIDKEGNVVDTEEQAMTLWEAFDINEKGVPQLNPHADHTTFSKSKLSDVGIIEHQALIRKKNIELQGQYDNRWQSDIQRYWWGKLIFMFRKWLIPAYYRRWRGAYHALTNDKAYDDLADNQKYYDLSTREYSEGMYTSMVRFVRLGLIPAIKEFRIELAKANWSDLSDMEKTNIQKTIRELLTTLTMITAGTIAVAAAKAAPDEDDEKILYLLAYLFKRQETELMQYYSPPDQLRIFRTPFASLNTTEKIVQWFDQMFPWNIDEKYEGGPNKGRYKAWVKSKRLMPAISQTERSAKTALSFLISISD